MARVEEGEIILETEEEVNNLIEAIKKEKVDHELIKKALRFRGKRLQILAIKNLID
ncbi:hypothetical protein [Saccharolobus islandicus]|uniref:Uncharacterized protein n=1 Tax=Saccharolobus islandicus (strain M.16.4 / Kamchatka \|nr:hypothetical protein [Sulfolobus islandicus]ACR42228.1 hypothetical protein M164_1625 [Sulfolobus islandicus M.16.4]